jgi:serine/threonine-protein kinase
MAVLDTKGQELAALSALLDRALELPDGERTRWIGSLPPEHGQLRPRLERMLSASRPGVTSRFLETIPKVHSGSVDEHAAFEHAGAPDERMPPSAEAGPYRIARKIADGGMGTVWLAYRTDVMVNRPVALKLPRRAFHSGQLAARIAEEREILAALNHPNIARLYDAGIAAGGQPYLALEYVEGRPIDEFVAARKQTIPARLRLFLLVARAVAHAHGRLVVHRDLKPSNIMVTEEGDVKLLDFGIAKLLDDGRFAGGGNAESSARLLTPDYASPEQLAGEPLGVATDVYSSGIVLYELLTGTRPSLDERLAAGRRPGGRAQPGVRPPSTVARDPATRRALLGDLDAIVLKAIAERPEERYATIGLLADDIDRYLQHQPVLARRATLRYRAAKYIARNTVAVAAAVAVLAATLAGTGLAAWQAHVALREKAHAVEVRDFLTTLFRDASPYNSGQRAMSALDWLKHARARVDRGLEKRPALRVEMLNIVGASLF